MLELYGRTLAWQWDTDQTVIVDGLPDGARVHFALSDAQTAYVVAPHHTSGHMLATIPNILLQDGGVIRCWTYADGKTAESASIIVRPRQKPDDYIYTPTEVESVETIKAWVAAEVERVSSPATTTTPGQVIVGDNLTVTNTGRVSADQERITYMDNTDFLALLN